MNHKENYAVRRMKYHAHTGLRNLYIAYVVRLRWVWYVESIAFQSVRRINKTDSHIINKLPVY